MGYATFKIDDVVIAPGVIAPSRLTINPKGSDDLEFTEYCSPNVLGTHHYGQTVELFYTDDSEETKRLFKGVLTDVHRGKPGYGCLPVSYACEGARMTANRIVVLNPVSGAGRMSFNMPRDSDDYARNLIGRTVGEMIYYVLAAHAGQLDDLGISVPTLSDLAGLTVVPPATTDFYGPILDSLQAALTQWCPKWQIVLDYDDMAIKVLDVLSLPIISVNLPSLASEGDGAMEFEPATESGARTASKLRVVGGPWIEAMSFSSTGTDQKLVPYWDPGLTAAFHPDDYKRPDNEVHGAFTGVGTALTLTIDGASETPSWDENYWSRATVNALFTAGAYGAGVQVVETRTVISCSASSGGTATINIDYPLTGSYTHLQIIGEPVGKALVHRRYTISSTADPGIAVKLYRDFNGRVFNWSPNANGVYGARSPAGVFYWSQGCAGLQQDFPAPFQIFPSPDGEEPGYILFDSPTAIGDSPACDVLALLPISTGALSVETEGHQGTAYTEDGIERTEIRLMPNFNYVGYAPQIVPLAQEWLDGVRDKVITGTLTWKEEIPLHLIGGVRVEPTNAEGDFGYEGKYFPTIGYSVVWPNEPGASVVCNFALSNQRRPFSGDRLYFNPVQAPRADFDEKALGQLNAALTSISLPQVGGWLGQNDSGPAPDFGLDFSHVDPKTGRDTRSAKDWRSAKDPRPSGARSYEDREARKKAARTKARDDRRERSTARTERSKARNAAQAQSRAQNQEYDRWQDQDGPENGQAAPTRTLNPGSQNPWPPRDSEPFSQELADEYDDWREQARY